MATSSATIIISLSLIYSIIGWASLSRKATVELDCNSISVLAASAVSISGLMAEIISFLAFFL